MFLPLNIVRYLYKVKSLLLSIPVDLLNEVVVEGIVVKDVIVLAIILRVVTLAVEGHFIVPKEEVECFNGGQIGFRDSLVSPEDCLLGLDLDLFEHHYIALL